MPGRRCAAAHCNNNAFDSRIKGLDISFHRFPKEEKLCKLWILRCYRKDSFNPQTSCVCSEHFLQEDFESNLRSDLMGIPSRRVLKKNVIPSVNLNQEETQMNHAKRSEQFEENEKKIMEEMLKPSISGVNMIEPQELQNSANITQPAMSKEPLEDTYYSLLREYQSLKKKYCGLESNNKKLKKDLSLALDQINVEKVARQSLEGILKSSFSEAQIDVMTKRKKRVHWSNDDISKAFNIRYLSKPCYIYLRDTLNYPLPHIDTLKKLASKFKLEDENGTSDLN